MRRVVVMHHNNMLLLLQHEGLSLERQRQLLLDALSLTFIQQQFPGLFFCEEATLKRCDDLFGCQFHASKYEETTTFA